MYKNVVLIDDSDIESQITRQILLKKSFAENIMMFNSAMAALVFLKNAAVFPEVIFLDINMPLMDGFEFLDNFDKLPEDKRGRSAIVVLTGSRSADDASRAVEHAEVKKVLRKPLTADKLAELQAMGNA